jgi:hypothetical protein
LPSEKARVAAEPQTVHIPIFESKLIKVIRIEPADDDRIAALFAQAEKEAALSKKDPPSESSIIRQALRLGVDELERRNSQKTVSPLRRTPGARDLGFGPLLGLLCLLSSEE